MQYNNQCLVNMPLICFFRTTATTIKFYFICFSSVHRSFHKENIFREAEFNHSGSFRIPLAAVCGALLSTSLDLKYNPPLYKVIFFFFLLFLLQHLAIDCLNNFKQTALLLL